jgi:hypothetical protein
MSAQVILLACPRLASAVKQNQQIYICELVASSGTLIDWHASCMSAAQAALHTSWRLSTTIMLIESMTCERGGGENCCGASSRAVQSRIVWHPE